MEHKTDDNRHWVLNELGISIRVDELRQVAQGVIDRDYKWAKSLSIKLGLSQGKHDRLKDDFLAKGYLERLPNDAKGFLVTNNGRRFFRGVVASIPSPK